MQQTLLKILQKAGERDLPCLLVGGNAVILFGFPRNTIDIDLLMPESSRSLWLDVMRELQFRLYHGTAAFAQFDPGEARGVPVDLMFVDENTWRILFQNSVEKTVAGQIVRLPRPEHLIALKLHAASSASRSKPEADWEDIRQIIRVCALDIADPAFREIVARYGGERALERLSSIRQ